MSRLAPGRARAHSRPHPFDPQASPLSASVPLLAGSTLNEFTNGINRSDAFDKCQAELPPTGAANCRYSSLPMVAITRALTRQQPSCVNLLETVLLRRNSFWNPR